MKRSLGGDLDTDAGGARPRSHWTTTARRSFFKRRKGGSSSGGAGGGLGSRSSSRDSKELAAFVDMGSLNSFGAEAVDNALQDNPQINSYVRVERLDCK